jgi:hypothetical protein
MTGSSHPSWEQLLDYAEQQLSAEHAERVRAHLDACAECAARLEVYRGFRADLETGDTGDAPEAWVRRAEGRTGRRTTATAAEARVVFDSLVDTLAGVRSGATAGRQYVIESGDVEVEIAIAPAGDEPWPVSGQLLTDDPERARGLDATLMDRGAAIETVPATEHGEFLFTHRPRGAFRVRLSGPALKLETPDLEP